MASLITTAISCGLLLYIIALPAWCKSPAPDAEARPSSFKQVSPRARRSPISIDYRFRDGPARLGEPLTLVIQYGFRVGNTSMEVHYHSETPQGLSLSSSQAASVLLDPDARGNYPEQEVVVVPMQSGRFYLQVSAGVQLEGRMLMRPLSIPIQVGPTSEEKVMRKSDVGEQGISLPARMD